MNERISVLLVEDEEHIRRVLQYNLQLDGFEVHQAENRARALELAARAYNEGAFAIDFV